jgi:nucleoside phosphorylase
MFHEIALEDFIKEYDINILLITATNIEFEVALKFLNPLDEDSEIFKIYHKHLTIYCGLYGLYSTALVKTNTMGSGTLGGALQTTTEAIQALSPNAVIMGGIAFGKNKEKQNFGDILISKAICHYESGKINEDGGYDYRGSITDANLILYNRFTQSSDYSFTYNDSDKLVNVKGGQFLSGEKLIDNEKFKQELFQQYPSAIGGEMEGAGLYSACEVLNVPWIVIKSICDWADGKKDKSQQNYAATASFSLINDYLQSKLILKDLKINPYKNENINSPEINIQADDVIKMLTSMFDFQKVAKSRKEVKNSEKRIYFEYYFYDNRGRTEGFLFLGKNVSVIQTLNDFKANFNSPNILNVFITKKYINGRIVDRKKNIIERLTALDIKKIGRSDIHYIDEFIWECTLAQYSNFNSLKRKDYIDQQLYAYDPVSNNEFGIGISSDYFSDELHERKIPISVILGGGGVGKTTFCEALRYSLDQQSQKKRKRAFFIKGERISYIKNTEEITVDSLMDLYDLYKGEDNFPNIRSDDFKLNYMCGNIVVVIDGLDEIDSALGEKFNIHNFFSSLSSLEERFYSTNIIITSRDYFESKLLDTAQTVNMFKLKGFTESDLDSFLKKRFNNSEVALRNQVKSFLEKEGFLRNSHYVPLFADWACEIVTRQTTSTSCNINKNESDFLFNNIGIDVMLMCLIERENDKQSLQVNIDDIFTLLIEIIVLHKGMMSMSDLEEYIAATFDEDYEKFLKNPLFTIFNNKSITMKYDALIGLVKSRFAHHRIVKKLLYSEGLVNVLKENYDGKSGTFNDLVETIDIADSNLIKNIRYYVEKLNIAFKESDNLHFKKNLQKSISGLLYLVVEKISPKNKEDRTQLLKEIYGTVSPIYNLFLFGDFYALDLSETVITDSLFDGYTNIENCTFSNNSDTVFMYSTFQNITLKRRTGLKRSLFDQSCKFNNCNIQETLENVENLEDSNLEQLKKNFISLTRFLDTSSKSYNLIKIKCSIKWFKGEKKFLKLLHDFGYLDLDKKGGTILYCISKEYHDAIPSVKIGRFPLKVEQLVLSIQAST